MTGKTRFVQDFCEKSYYKHSNWNLCNVFCIFSFYSSLQTAPQLANRIEKVKSSCCVTVCLLFISFSLTKILRFSPDKQFLFHLNLPLKNTKKIVATYLFVQVFFLMFTRLQAVFDLKNYIYDLRNFLCLIFIINKTISVQILSCDIV